jgi:hypothetical protein
MSNLENLTPQEKKQNALRGMSRFDAVALVANMALELRDAGHDLVVRHALVSGKRGILIFAPGFELIDGNLRLVATAPAPQEEPTP